MNGPTDRAAVTAELWRFHDSLRTRTKTVVILFGLTLLALVVRRKLAVEPLHNRALLVAICLSAVYCAAICFLNRAIGLTAALRELADKQGAPPNKRDINIGRYRTWVKVVVGLWPLALVLYGLISYLYALDFSRPRA